MEILKDNKLQKFILYKDFIRKSFDKEGNPVYKQSNTRLQGYIPRCVGVALVDNKVLVASTIDYKDKNNDKVARTMIRNRLAQILDTDYNIVDDSNQVIPNITYVPTEFLDLLWKDQYTYNNIGGMIDPTYCMMAINSLHAE